METKLCALCKQVKPITEFWRKCTAPDGHDYSCKTCRHIKKKKPLDPDLAVGYEALFGEILNQTVRDSKHPSPFCYSAGDKRGVREPDGREWMHFEVSRRECLDFVCGPEFEYYAKAVNINLTIDEMRRVMLDRMGVNDVLVEVR